MSCEQDEETEIIMEILRQIGEELDEIAKLQESEDAE